MARIRSPRHRAFERRPKVGASNPSPHALEKASIRRQKPAETFWRSCIPSTDRCVQTGDLKWRAHEPKPTTASIYIRDETARLPTLDGSTKTGGSRAVRKP